MRGPCSYGGKILCITRKNGKKSCAAVRNKTAFSDFCCSGIAKIVRNVNRSRNAPPTLKTYPLHIIVEADAISCVIFFICFCSARIVHFFICKYLRTIYCVCKSKFTSRVRTFYSFCKKWRQGPRGRSLRWHQP